MDKWVIRNVLARSPMPGFDPKNNMPVPLYRVTAWLETMWDSRVKSILCLLDDDEVHSDYARIPRGLIRYYEDWGFRTAHVPVKPGADPALTLDQCKRLWAAFSDLPHPVVVHCKDNGERTDFAIRFIRKSLENGSVKGKHAVQGKP
jgi:hypothetical protein